MKKMFLKLRPFTSLVVLVAFCVMGSSLADLGMPSLLAKVIDDGVANGDMPFIIKTGFKMLGVAVFGVLCTIGTGYCSSKISSGFGQNLRGFVFRKVETFSLADFDQFGASSLITRTTNDINQVQHFMMMFLRVMISSPITAIGGVVMAFQKGPKLAAIVLITMPMIVLLVITVARRAIPITMVMQQKLDRVNQVLREKLTGVRVIRAFNTAEYEERRFDTANGDLTHTTIKMQRMMNLLQPAVMLVLNLSTVVLVWVGALQISYGEMKVGDIMAVVQYVSQILMSMMMLSMVFIRIPRASASAERINAVLERNPSIVDGPITQPETGLRGCLEFRDVSFTYPGSTLPAIEQVSFSAKPGQTVAIIGSTGSGKTTLLNLIPRFYDVSAGAVLVDGVDVRDYTQKALRERIGFVPQKSVLFFGTIGENIRQGKPDATEEEILHAAEVSQAMAFISEKPEGFDTPIAQGGTNVSGGQKQRLSIARAVVRKPEIYVFDDSFSALDFKTDAALRVALAQETRDAVVLIVAQRVSTIINADTILVLEEGKVVGEGTHHGLMESCPVYREIVLSQLSEEEVAR